MRKHRVRVVQACLLLLVLAFTGCNSEDEEYIRPEAIKDFNVLYSQNCSGCHGVDGRNGAAQPLNDPLYQHLVNKDQLRKVITQGRRGTSMTGWSQAAGGILTNQQIDILVDGMQSKWRGSQDFPALPSYEIAGQGDPQRGQAAYQAYCANCHGPDGNCGKAGSIVNASLLGLSTNQSLRTTVIAGRPDMQIPDWRGYVPNHPMSDQEISDVVAWLASFRPHTATVSQAYPPKEYQLLWRN